jgi:hypothetical protein
MKGTAGFSKQIDILLQNSIFDNPRKDTAAYQGGDDYLSPDVSESVLCSKDRTPVRL